MDNWINSIGNAEDQQALFEVLVEYCQQQALSGFAYVLSSPHINSHDQFFIMENYPAEWIRFYLQNRYYLYDPVIAAIKTADRSFVWSESLDLNKLPDKSSLLMEEAKQCNIVDGMSIPVDPHRGLSLTFLIERPLDLVARKKNILISHLAHEQMIEILNYPVKLKKLTSREAECLIWTAAGKTSDEVGLILNLSARTVNEYIGNAMKKLNAGNKTQAIIKALVEREFAFSDIRL